MSEFASFGRMLMVFGIVLVIAGALLTFAGKVPRLPGDIVIKRDTFVFYFPLATSLLLSAILTIILTLLFARR